jgi:insulysin
MNLVMVGRNSLDELEKYAVENFAGVEDRNLPIQDFTKEKVFDQENTFEKICKIIPAKDIKTLTLNWQLPLSPSFSRTKSSHYLSHVIGHEGPNSLLS